MNNLNLRKIMEEKEINTYNIWHPFSNLQKNYFNQLVINEGEGIYVYDNNKKCYIDACSGLWNMSLGYNNTRINNYIKKQLDKLPFCSLFEHTNSTVVLAANKILDLLPRYMNKLMFTCSGSESNDLAIKCIREYWHILGQPNKNTIISFNKSYHGTYYGSMSISGITQRENKGYNPLLSQIVMKEVPSDLYSNEDNKVYMQKLVSYIEEYHHQIAGIIIEPILTSSGMEIVPCEYINEINELCQKYNILVATDEVALGFYRTGKAFYFYNTQLKPDLVCMAKGINAGYLPLGAVAFSDKVIEVYKNNKSFLSHGSTQAGNLLACSAVIGALEEYKEQNIQRNVENVSTYLLKQLKEKLVYHSNVKSVRGVGLLISIDLVNASDHDKTLEEVRIAHIQNVLAEEGLLVYRSMIGLLLFPILTITIEEADKITKIIENVFHNYIF
ncbi:adenosylmethionine--8-amino-7-oxononanoate transaminase [Vallitalea longa]|uniref:Adenosylmethionine--8-amino-7-oxononanoate transaminase n=1 Tax=Vallitalea longa TaxID=2936439 RepID=A0A9W5YFL7_9FIRM|nr:aminotransferase class III-fold pyridoxal phosphate-dependent enzyme [Vallitalea longa]GKX32159.1 adenosylmethionine--8-amino-7-oxononanoate transaminase [Vallitalea longa]